MPFSYNQVEIDPHGPVSFEYVPPSGQDDNLKLETIGLRQHLLNILTICLLSASICVMVLSHFNEWNWPYWYMSQKGSVFAVAGTNFGITFLGTVCSVLSVASLRRNMAKNIDVMLQEGMSVQDFHDLAKLQTGRYVSPLRSARSTKSWAAMLLFTSILTSSMVSIMSSKQINVELASSVSNTTYCESSGQMSPSKVFPPLQGSELDCFSTGNCPGVAGQIIANFLTTLTYFGTTRNGDFQTDAIFQSENSLVSNTLFDMSGACYGLTPCQCPTDGSLTNNYISQALDANYATQIRGANYLTAEAVRVVEPVLTSHQISVANKTYQSAACGPVNLNPGQLELAYCGQQNATGNTLYQLAVINGGPGSDSAVLFNDLIGENLSGWQAAEFTFELIWRYNSTIQVIPGNGVISTMVNNNFSTAPLPKDAAQFSKLVMNSAFNEWVNMNANNGSLLVHELAQVYDLASSNNTMPSGFESDLLLTYILEVFLSHSVVAVLNYYNNGVAALDTNLVEYFEVYLLGPRSSLSLVLIGVPALILLSVIVTYVMAYRGKVHHMDLGDPLSLLLGTNNHNMALLTKDHDCPKEFIEKHGNTVIRTCRGDKPGITIEPVLGVFPYDINFGNENK